MPTRFTTLPTLFRRSQCISRHHCKCGLFGVCCEAIPRQVDFFIDEGVLTGKGASSTISYIHYFFEWHGLGETFTQIHVHNCGAQNKNNALIDVVLPLDRSPCFGEWWPGYVQLFNSGTCEICTRLVLRTCQAKNKENVYFITIWYSKGSRSRIPRQWTRLSCLDCTMVQYWSQRTIGWVTSIHFSRRFRIWKFIITSDLIKPFQEQCFANIIFHPRKRLLTFLKLTGTCSKQTFYLLLLHLKASAMKGPNTCSEKFVSFVNQEPKTLLPLKSIKIKTQL